MHFACHRFSGVTEEDLVSATITLRDVQAVLLSMFSAESILIGHSLESDLLALKVLKLFINLQDFLFHALEELVNDSSNESELCNTQLSFSVIHITVSLHHSFVFISQQKT